MRRTVWKTSFSQMSIVRFANVVPSAKDYIFKSLQMLERRED